MRFAPAGTREHYLDITLGMSQPIASGRTASQWEFAVYSLMRKRWQPQLLYDLVTHFIVEDEEPAEGDWLPLVFFEDHKGSMACGLTEKPTKSPIGEIRGLYLWPDYHTPAFPLSTGRFRLMVAVAVTKDEDEAAREASPPHLLALLRRLGLGLFSDPFRKSAFTLRNAAEYWRIVRRRTRAEVISELSVLDLHSVTGV